MSTTWRCGYCDTTNNPAAARCVVCEQPRPAGTGTVVYPAGQEPPGYVAPAPHAPVVAPVGPSTAAPRPVTPGFTAPVPDPGPAVAAPAGFKPPKKRGGAKVVVIVIALAVLAGGGGFGIAKLASGSPGTNTVARPTTTDAPDDVETPGTSVVDGGEPTDVATGPVTLIVVAPSSGTHQNISKSLDVAAKTKPAASVTGAELFIDDVSAATNKALSFSVAPPSAGAHTLRMTATLSDGTSVSSEPVTFTVDEVVAPAPPPAAGGGEYRLTDKVNLRARPDQDSDVLHKFTEDPGEVLVGVQCYVKGREAPDDDTGRKSVYWDRVNWAGTVGYISDLFVATPKDGDGVPLIPVCTDGE